MQKTFYFLLVGLLTLNISCQTMAQNNHPAAINDQAPAFTTKASKAGQSFEFSLKRALKTGPVVVYFYPSAYTGGCDIEAHTFAVNSENFKSVNTTIVGVSADNIERLNQFSADPDFCAGAFPVASDSTGEIARAYGLEMIPEKAGAKDVKGNEINHGFIPRTTFVLNQKGIIVAKFSSEKDGISPAEHVTKALEAVKKLQGQ